MVSTLKIICPAEKRGEWIASPRYAIAALEEAQAQAGLVIDSQNAFDVGVIVGSAVGGIATYTRELDIFREKGPRRVNPMLIPSMTIDVPSIRIAIQTGAQGVNYGIATACSTGADAIGLSFEAIRRGDVKAIIAGGAEAAVTPIGIVAFDRLRALSRNNDDPCGASRPFDAERDGTVMADGAAVLVVEELEHALERGAEPMAEVLSYAATSDAAHLTAPDSEGAGAARCMSLAVERANLSPQEISYINAHGTSTRSGDVAETLAIKQVFGDYADKLPVSSTKSMTGHMIGAAGAAETIFCIQALRNGVIPPTINYQTADPDCDLDYVPNRAREADLQYVLSNSFGFGGHNTSLVLGPYN